MTGATQGPGQVDRASPTHVRQDESAEVEVRLLRTLYELSASAGRRFDPGELVRLVGERACELLAADAVALCGRQA